MDIYKEAEKLGMDNPLTEIERKELEGLLSNFNKNSSTYKVLLKVLCSEKRLQEENIFLESLIDGKLLNDYKATPNKIFDL